MEWISVQDRRPSIREEWCLAYGAREYEYDNFDVLNPDVKLVVWHCVYSGGSFYGYAGLGNSLVCDKLRVTHWMPLPNPPEENEK